MANLTIRMDPREKEKLMAWAAVRGTSTTVYIKQPIAADMAAGSPQDRAAAWFRENEAAISAEAQSPSHSRTYATYGGCTPLAAPDACPPPFCG